MSGLTWTSRPARRRSSRPPCGGRARACCRDVDAGELEVGRREVVEDHVGVRLPAAGRLDCARIVADDLVVDRQVVVDVEDRAASWPRRRRRDLSVAALRPSRRRCRPRSRVSVPSLKSARAQDVALAARDVAGLRVARAAGLVLPAAVVLLRDQAELAVGLAVAAPRAGAGVGRARRVGAVRLARARRGTRAAPAAPGG